jgi:Na+/H+-dicarboxylate symporter
MFDTLLAEEGYDNIVDMKRSWPLHVKITLGMILGFFFGLCLNFSKDASSLFSDLVTAAACENILWWLNLIGKDIFIGLLKMLIAPLVFASIISGITSLPESKELGQIGMKTLAFYLLTTTLAVGIGLGAVLLIRPGKQAASQVLRAQREGELKEYRNAYSRSHGGVDPLDEKHRRDYLTFISEKEDGALSDSSNRRRWEKIRGTKDKGVGDMFKQDILKPILSNPFRALAAGNTLGIIFFAVLMGLACLMLGGVARPVVDFFKALNAVVMKLTLWMMTLAPYSIFCLIASLVASIGLDIFAPLAWYGGTVIIGIVCHMLALLFLVALLGRMNPWHFLKGIRNAWVVAFTTTSSAATLPVTLECVTDRLKVSPKVAGFSLPLGATVNMDGTALYEGVSVIFLLQLYGGLDDVPLLLSAAKIFMIFITAVLASVGAAAVPSAGLVTMAIVASAVGLPLHYIAVLFVIDHFLDMFRTSTNVTGDAAAAVVVHHWERGRLSS